MLKNTQQLNVRIEPYLTFTILISGLYALMFYLQPPMMDDGWFESYSSDFIANPSFSTFINCLTDSVIFRINEDNGRIVNLLGNFLVIIPKPILGILLGACVGLTLYFGAILSKSWKNSLPAFTLLSLSLAYVLPWFDGMFTTMHALNYVLPSAISFATIILFLSDKIRNKPLSFILFFIIGTFHEAFSAALIGGIIGVVITVPRYRSARSIAMILGLLAAIIYLGSIPGASRRGNGMFGIAGLWQLSLGIVTATPYYVFVIVTLLCMFFRKMRKRLFSPTLAFLFGGALAGWLVWRCFMSDYRIPWIMLLFTAPGLAYLFSKLLPSLKSSISTSVALLILILIIIQSTVSVVWFYKMKREVMLAINTTTQSPDKSGIFLPIHTSDTAPIYLLGKPTFDVYLTPGYPFDRIVPEALKDFSPQKARRLSGNVEAYYYKDYIVLKIPDSSIEKWNCTVYFDGKPVSTVGNQALFYCSDGEYSYFLPIYITMPRHLYTITGIDIISPFSW
ncbi:MAG: hypothetical protein NC418_10890 [Muribaculaceae bacterium]|nr:hypothetical protein [Muribaculaceae bacterium]